jgi:hypothetical protein
MKFEITVEPLETIKVALFAVTPYLTKTFTATIGFCFFSNRSLWVQLHLMCMCDNIAC